ncbi:hypothetical protein C0993_001925, partial [Termitomyces sp. T159_Od127]
PQPLQINTLQFHRPQQWSMVPGQPPGHAAPRDHPQDGTAPPFGKIYNMSEVEFHMLKDYLNDMLGKGFI